MACQVAPYIKGKKSELYMDILNKVGNDRRIANRLYAISLCLKDELVKKNTNNQGEWDSNAFFERIKIDDILPKSRLIANLSKQYGFMAKNGDLITFNTVDEIKNDVFNFNEENPNLVAEIDKVKGGFQVTISPKHDENFSTNTNLKAREAQWNALISALHFTGFNTSFNDFNEYYNFFNIENVKSRLDKLMNLKGNSVIGVRMAQFIVETMKGTELYDRLKGIFGDDLVNAIVSLTYEGTNLSLPDGTVVEFTDPESNEHKKLLRRFINNFKTKLNRIDYNSLKSEFTEESKRVYKENWDNDNLGVTEKSVRETLKGLYKDYKLNLDLVNQVKIKLDRVSNIAKEFSRINAINLNLLRKDKKLKKFEVEAGIRKLERKIEAGEYYVSISEYLSLLVEQVKGLDSSLNDLMEKLSESEDGTFDREAINTIAGIISRMDYLYKCNYDVIEKLNLKDYTTGELSIDNDDDVASADIKQKVADVSGQIMDVLKQFKAQLESLSVKVIYAFLKEQWGSNTDLTEDLIKAEMVDIGVLSRYIYSIYDCPNELISTLGKWVNVIDRQRDLRLKNIVESIRRSDSKLNGHTKFMFVMDSENIPTGKIISPYDFLKYNKDRSAFIEELKKLNLDQSTFLDRLNEWEKEHTINIKLGQDLYNLFGINIYDTDVAPDFQNDDSLLSINVPYYVENGKNIYASDDLKNISTEQKEYYTSMAKLRLELIDVIPEMAGNFYDAVQLSSDFINSIKNAGMNPTKFAKLMREKFGDIFKLRVDDTEYGGIATVNGIREDLVDAQGNIVYRLPIFFTHQLERRERMSTDYSRSMTAMATAVINYDEMSKYFEILLLSKEFIAKKNVTETLGDSVVALVYDKATGVIGINSAIKKGESRTAGFLNDWFESNVIGRRRKPYVVGNVNIDKIADTLTRYTSVVGLSTNIIGAQANLLVGKVLMLIEAGLFVPGGGEFFNMKDYRKAMYQYGKMMWSCIAEIASNNKKSKLSLLMDFFDVSSDWFEKLKEDGYHSSMIAKVLGNSSLFMLYGGGEHMLHAETMLAVLNHIKVKGPNGENATLFDALDVKVEDNNGSLYVKKGYTYNGKPIVLDDMKGILETARNTIKYCNDSMHGAFGTKDKGMIHRVFFGRMLMNFRQWMPAHYQRRFAKKHYNSIIQQDREGFYRSAGRFVWLLAKDLRHAKFQAATRWKQMSDMERYNCKRTFTETMILMLNYALIVLAGDYKDHKNNWARRNMIQQLRRLDMEIGATNIFPLAPSGLFSDNKSYKGKSLFSPLKNTLKLLNSPFSSINTAETAIDLFAFADMRRTYEAGRYKGQNIYLHNVEKNVPLLGKLRLLLIDFKEEDGLFQYMDD